MCGIAGTINFKGKTADQGTIELMTAQLTHRGPDGAGIYCDGNVSLGHRRLAIFDLSVCGAQPMHSSDDRFTIVHNGEVYNWPEIRKQLKFNQWKSQTDTETILQAFIEWGEECLEQFNGMFAFAIWDKKEKRMFLARDRIGIKPLYYFMENGNFYFASEMKALFAAGVEKKPNYPLIYDFLRWGLIDHCSSTFFEGIVSLEAGHSLSIAQDGKVSKKKYWNLAKIINERPQIDLPDAIDQFSDLMEDSIDLRLRADVPISSFLSGGVDSSIMTSKLAQKAGTKRLEAYTYEFDTGGAGEGEYAKEVADWLNVDIKMAVLNHKDVSQYINKVLFNEEMPVTSMRVLSAHKLYEQYRDGSTVILEGHGGDHIGGGFEYYFIAYILDLIEREGSSFGIDHLNQMMDMYGIPEEKRYQKFTHTLGAYLRPGASCQDGTPFVKPLCFDEGFLSAHGQERIHFKRPLSSHLLNAQYVDILYHNLPRVLRYADRGSMAVGRETRVPLLDHRIVELGLTTTERARVNNYQQRYFMREAEKKFLPEHILNRPKRSIVDPQRRWLQHELKDWVTDIFHSDSFKSRNIFNQEEVVKEYERYCNEENPTTGFHIFQYINVELWFRQFIDNETIQTSKSGDTVYEQV